MLDDKDYRILSERIYWLDRNHDKYDPFLNEGNIIKEKDFQFKILKVEDNSTNGMQAMAVAPVINGKVDTSEIFIAFAGTNPNDELNIQKDLQTVIQGNKQLDISRMWESGEYIEGMRRNPLFKMLSLKQ